MLRFPSGFQKSFDEVISIKKFGQVKLWPMGLIWLLGAGAIIFLDLL